MSYAPAAPLAVFALRPSPDGHGSGSAGHGDCSSAILSGRSGSTSWARRLHREVGFELVQHVMFVKYWTQLPRAFAGTLSLEDFSGAISVFMGSCTRPRANWPAG